MYINMCGQYCTLAPKVFVAGVSFSLIAIGNNSQIPQAP